MAERFGAYTVHEELGVGGMASVHLAEWQGPNDLRRRVALKRLFPHIAQVPELLAMFIDEARLARYLRHPNIAQVYEYGRISGTYFIAFEFVPGPTVQQLMRQASAAVGDIPIPIVLEIARQLCDALDHAHNLRNEANELLGIVHRDVSPQNLIISNVGFVKLIDFGLAKAKYSSVQSQAGVIKGKLHYVAPEYLAGSLDARCDLWAVGVVMHEMLTGKRLFDAGENFEVLDRVRSMPIQPPSKSNPMVGRVLDDIVMTALERDPRKRWHTAEELRTAIAGHVADHRAVTRSQLVAWVEWAFTQKQKQKQDSGISALHEILESGQVEEVHEIRELDELDDAKTAFVRLPATSAAMMERRRESQAMARLVRDSRAMAPVPHEEEAKPAPPATPVKPAPAAAPARAAKSVPPSKSAGPKGAPVGAAMLARNKSGSAWLWLLLVLVLIGGGVAALAHYGVIGAPHL